VVNLVPFLVFFFILSVGPGPYFEVFSLISPFLLCLLAVNTGYLMGMYYYIRRIVECGLIRQLRNDYGLIMTSDYL
jgi:hypothetical protein